MSMSKEAKEANERFKAEVAKELGIDLQKKNSNLSASDAGRIGGTMVRKMIEEYRKNQNSGQG